MSRYRLLPSPAQEAVLRGHCAHARYVWNLAVEQYQHWRPGRKGAPGYLEQSRQLTEARAEHDWLRAGSQTVQQQALRDFAQSRKMGQVRVPKAGRVRFRWSRAVPAANNIAAGHVVTARGGYRDTGPVNHAPQLLASLTGCE